MKKIFTLAIALTSVCAINAQTNVFPATGAAGIGTLTPNASSLLEITSTTKGILIPRMTQAQRNAIVGPATGLMIYQTNNTPGFYYYDGGAWVAVTPKNKGWSLTGNAGTNPLTSFVGTSDLQKLVFRVNNQQSGLIDHDSLKANTAFGYQSLLVNAGANNTATGYRALSFNSTGTYNTANGYQALSNNTAGSSNTGHGSWTLYSNTTGALNTAVGYAPLFSNTTGYANTATGYEALYFNTTGYSNVANGYNALFLNSSGNSNVAIGAGSLYHNTTQSNNVAVGDSTLFSNSADLNTAIGSKALYANTSGNQNTANGYQALYSNTIAYGNTANGFWALHANTEGIQNTATGYDALKNSTTGRDNSAYGSWSLFSNVTGSYNTGIAYRALVNNLTGSNNTALGAYADVSLNNLTNATAIGYNAIVDASNKVVVGQNVAGMVIGGYAPWSTLVSDGRFKENVKEDVPGLKFITKLRPVTYTINTQKLDEHIMQYMPDSVKAKRRQKPEDYTRASTKIQTGFIAQEVEKTAMELGYNFDGVNAPQNPTDNYSIAYSQFVIPLVKAVQELSKMNDDKDARIDELETRLSKLEAIMNAQLAEAGEQSARSQHAINITSASLQQNVPNPFNHTTSIEYTLPQQFSAAKIRISNNAGAVLKEINVSGTGKGRLKIDASTLTSGAYSYSLFVDGRLVATKQMVLTK